MNTTIDVAFRVQPHEDARLRALTSTLGMKRSALMRTMLNALTDEQIVGLTAVYKDDVRCGPKGPRKGNRCDSTSLTAGTTAAA